MKSKTLLSLGFQLGLYAIFMIMLLASCQKLQRTWSESSLHDQVYQSNISQVRLGDGVPLDLSVSIRWKVTDPELFFHQFDSTARYEKQVLGVRMQQLAQEVSNEFPSVDSVFSTHKIRYMNSVAGFFRDRLQEEGIQIKDVILSDIVFPEEYTRAKEEIGLNRQERERIRQWSKIELERSEAERKKAQADGKVAIAKAEANGRLQEIQAKTESSRRQSELARAETQSQLSRLNAEAEVERKRLLARADLDRQRDLKDLDLERTRESARAEADRQRLMDQVELEKQNQLAVLCTSNPIYASFLVNRELASKVEIAVLPSGADPNVFGNFLRQNIPTSIGQ